MLSKITAALLAVLLLYGFPMLQNTKRQEDLSQLNAYRIVAQFVDAVRTKGYITPSMYNEFTGELGTMMEGFELEMEHRHKKYQPEYEDAADAATFLGKFSVHEEAHFGDEIMEQLFPIEPANSKLESRVYYLSAGDYFDVRLQDQSKRASSILNRFLYGEDFASSAAPLEYGGMVLNEDY
ncbi:hypothetical protein [Paenibacillus physcomitrellae]|uniref:hypothetical protein n=1 Tax=Paenibacillus physcomitrellae TaxID=1619311 RepID=UPI001FD38222|nr:hypothetical protein [Paenibacillus physcomitrellae]